MTQKCATHHLNKGTVLCVIRTRVRAVGIGGQGGNRSPPPKIKTNIKQNIILQNAIDQNACPQIF